MSKTGADDPSHTFSLASQQSVDTHREIRPCGNMDEEELLYWLQSAKLGLLSLARPTRNAIRHNRSRVTVDDAVNPCKPLVYLTVNVTFDVSSWGLWVDRLRGGDVVFNQVALGRDKGGSQVA